MPPNLFSSGCVSDPNATDSSPVELPAIVAAPIRMNSLLSLQQNLIFIIRALFFDMCRT